VPVTWREGVHISGTPIWCDARRRRDVCFASSADRVGDGHGQLIGTPETLALLDVDVGDGHLAVPVRQRFTLGTLRLELLPSGRGVGTAALHVDAPFGRLLYAGPIRTARGGLGEPAEVRPCDALVVAAPFGEPHHAFEPIADVAARVVAWARGELAAGRRPNLVVDSVGDALEVGDAIDAASLPLAGTVAVQRASTLRGPHVAAIGKQPCVVLRVAGPKPARTRTGPSAYVSGRAIDASAAIDYDAAFAWPFAAGRAELLAWIESAGARRIYVTGPCAEAIVAALGDDRAQLLGPPRQMALFAESRA
jgi:putative mRNA 3-end processing factor